MENVISLLHGFQAALTPTNLLFCFIGVLVGQIVGVLPGLGPVAGTAMLIPLTYALSPTTAVIMLAGIFYGAMYGGTITSVLINVPGEGASVITCIDGYKMAKQGRGGHALGVAAIGSFIGGCIAVFFLTFLGPVLAKYALKFGPPEFFSIMIFGLLLLVGLIGKSVIKGLIAALIGMILALVGQDPGTGVDRFLFGQIELLEGIDFVILAIGLFGLSEILTNSEEDMTLNKPEEIAGLIPPRAEWKPCLSAILRGTGIGGLLGLIPGTSASIASLMSYSLERKMAKDPSRFGEGAIEGVAGPETANNSYAGAALIPLFTLGIPTSPTIAVLLGAFIMHGLTPGPLLYIKNPDFIWAVVASMFIGNLILLIMNLPLAKYWAKIALVPYELLFPLILLVCMVGVYSVNRSLWDVGMTIGFGAIGYMMKKWKLPTAALILSFVLGKNIEFTLVQTLTLSDNGLLYLFERPISGTLLTLCGIILAAGLYTTIKNKRGALAADEEA
ncbi:tripartite tricarboxylate transporter permease [Propionivibrio soli]|uniref:tripartite tricarboxylate transporter permease n=1 Tax=Propionivibrio soli TaxID=2976531 RepID=UPI0021E6E8CB|nr:tripartite tricarboxylate transporter permease [Propionivibrio soli]